MGSGSAVYAGAPGAFGEEALISHFGPDMQRAGVDGFHEVFEAITSGSSEFGVIPIENSLAGSVFENYDLLLDHPDARIVGEVSLPIRHHLLVHQGVDVASLTHCYSHPQALAQCAEYLRAHHLQPRAASNTAIAASQLAESGEVGAAAIASARAAELNGLVIAATDIQTRTDNTTRFFVITAGRAQPSAEQKASLVFGTKNQPGALLRCLEVFQRHNLNMTKLESRPTGGTLWEYNFYVDIEAAEPSAQLPKGIAEIVTAELLNDALFVRLLGTYARAASAPAIHR